MGLTRLESRSEKLDYIRGIQSEMNGDNHSGFVLSPEGAMEMINWLMETYVDDPYQGYAGQVASKTVSAPKPRSEYLSGGGPGSGKFVR